MSTRQNKINRRDFLKVVGLGAAASCIPGVFNCGIRKKQPNILFIMSDDHTAQAIGAYGGRLAKLNPTPTIDRLANEGILLENAFCTNSICVPSRACIMTGQYSQTNGVLDNSDSLPPEKQYLAIEMKKAGYETAMIGKWHLKNEPVHFNYYCVLPGQGKYFNPVFREKRKGEWPNNLVKHEGHSTDVIMNIALSWLKNRDKTKPFFLMLHFKAPHGRWANAKRYDSYLEEVEIPEPESLYHQPNFGSVATRGENDSLIHEIGSSVSKRNPHRNVGKDMKVDSNLPDKEYTHIAYQRYLKRYLRCVKGIDDNLVRLFDYMDKDGLMDKTVIWYTGDQGFFLGEHDFFDKRWMYEESMRMPLLIRFPKLIKAGSRTDALINNTDFAPTMIELAGGKVPDYMQGRSFVKILQGKEEKNWRTATYYRYWMHMASHANPAHFGIRTKDCKLIFFYGIDYKKGRKSGKWFRKEETPAGWELYNLKEDPHEMNNVYNDPKYKNVIKRLKVKLLRVRQELNETDKNYPQIQKIIDAHWDD